MRKQTDEALWWIGLGVSAAVGAAIVLATDRRVKAGSRSLRTVDRVDLNRYAGTWYEISCYPNPFERDCAGDTTAHYSLRRDGRLEVVNSCRTPKGKIQTVRGLAKVVDHVTNAKLKVQYRRPFAGDYWVLILNSFYEYAVVGEPSRKYLWILSRTPTLDKGTYHGILQRIEELGYDPSKLRLTEQNQGTYESMANASELAGQTNQKNEAARAKAAVAAR